MGDAFILVYNFHVPLSLKVGCACSGVTCVTALVFIFLCVGLMAVFCGVTFFSCFLSIGVYFAVSQSWFGVVWCVSAAGGVFACPGVTVCRVLSRLCLSD
jgi:hypothetical protein